MANITGEGVVTLSASTIVDDWVSTRPCELLLVPLPGAKVSPSPPGAAVTATSAGTGVAPESTSSAGDWVYMGACVPAGVGLSKGAWALLEMLVSEPRDTVDE